MTTPPHRLHAESLLLRALRTKSKLNLPPFEQTLLHRPLITAPWNKLSITTNYELWPTKRNPIVWFQELITEIAVEITLFTDGSKSSSAVGCSVIENEDVHICYNLSTLVLSVILKTNSYTPGYSCNNATEKLVVSAATEASGTQLIPLESTPCIDCLQFTKFHIFQYWNSTWQEHPRNSENFQDRVLNIGSLSRSRPFCSQNLTAKLLRQLRFAPTPKFRV